MVDAVVDGEGVGAGGGADLALGDLEQVAGLVGEADDVLEAADGAGGVVGEVAAPGVGQVGCDPGGADEVAEAARDDVDRGPGCRRRPRSARGSAAEHRRHAVEEGELAADLLD